MKRVIVILAAILFVAACVPETRNGKLSLKLISIERESQVSAPNQFIVKLSIEGESGYDGTAQDLVHFDPVSGTQYLVEFFRTPSVGSAVDRHTIIPGHYREMVLYPSNVKDTAESDYGYAMLPQNIDGSVISDDPPGIEYSHYLTYGLRGFITKVGTPIHWSIDTRNGMFTLIIDGNIVESFPI